MVVEVLGDLPDVSPSGFQDLAIGAEGQTVTLRLADGREVTLQLEKITGAL